MPTEQLALAVDLGGTKVESALVNQDGRVLEDSRHRAPTGRDIQPPELEKAVRAVVSATMGDARAAGVIGVGIGSAGPVASEAGEISPLNMPNCWDFPLAAVIADASGISAVSLHLDGLCIALAEHWVGALREYRTALGMVVSTGIGGGILVDGRFLSGKTGNAGHVGQVRVSSPTAAGMDLDTTLEGTASGPNIVRWAQARGWIGETGEDLAKSYVAGDPIAISAVYRCGEAIGFAIATVGALVDLEAVAIGGGFSRVTPDLFTIANATLQERTPLKTMKGIRIVPSALSDDGPLIGAGGLIHRRDLVPHRD